MELTCKGEGSPSAGIRRVTVIVHVGIRVSRNRVPPPVIRDIRAVVVYGDIAQCSSQAIAREEA